ncbi:MAG: hypothetical protein BM558_03395 [Roseobacter sp. MedPE-SW]|nr:MAG: hypothetical protein BM558_03395 [Roseobacter sp. MedPE-SW]
MPSIIKFLLLGLVLVLAVNFTTGAQAANYSDRDWNVRMKDNCGQPVSRGAGKSVQWVEGEEGRKLRVQLDEGQIGKCWTDSEPNEWSKFRERAEIQQSKLLRLGKHYRISFSVQFDEGFTGFKETFFQIHGWNGNCQAAPPVMFLFDKSQMIVWSLRGVRPEGESTWQAEGFGSHKRVQERNIHLNSLRGRENSFVVDFDTRGPTGTLSVWVNGQSIVQNAIVEYASCARPYIKMGVYRDGGHRTGRSVATFDDIQVQTIQ